MRISGFTYVRNGFHYGYPFVASIRSLLPLVDECIVVVGDSHDGTRDAIVAINDPKITIIDTVWDEDLRVGGKIFAQQSNLGLSHTTGDWAFHLQVDEVLHEADYPTIRAAIHTAHKRNDIDGILLPFLHFWGDFDYIRNTRRTHPFEIRVFKSNKNIFSYKDSQGFRKYTSKTSYETGEKGEKLQVLLSNTPVYHYSYTRHPRLMQQKANYFNRFWHNDEWVKTNIQMVDFDFNQVDALSQFKGTHPALMQETIAAKDWDFKYEPSKSNMKWTDKILMKIEYLTGKRLFAYKNYILRS